MTYRRARVRISGCAAPTDFLAVVLVYYVPIADNDALDGLHPGCLMPSVIHTEARKIARYTKSILSGREKEREKREGRRGRNKRRGMYTTGRGERQTRRGGGRGTRQVYRGGERGTLKRRGRRRKRVRCNDIIELERDGDTEVR